MASSPSASASASRWADESAAIRLRGVPESGRADMTSVAAKSSPLESSAADKLARAHRRRNRRGSGAPGDESLAEAPIGSERGGDMCLVEWMDDKAQPCHEIKEMGRSERRDPTIENQTRFVDGKGGYSASSASSMAARKAVRSGSPRTIATRAEASTTSLKGPGLVQHLACRTRVGGSGHCVECGQDRRDSGLIHPASASFRHTTGAQRRLDQVIRRLAPVSRDPAPGAPSWEKARS